MRIGIITQPLRYNYGGILQNFALHIALSRMGHQVITLDGEVKTKKKTSLQTIKSCIKKLILASRDKKSRILGFYTYNTTTELLSQNTRKFIKAHIPVRSIKSYKDNDFDALIVGSDQVWRPAYSVLDDAYLKFAEHNDSIVKISYAASFGSDEWEYTDEESCKYAKLAKKFKAISVREESGVNLCRKFLKVDASYVLDPTMLLTKEDYISLVGLCSVQKSEGELFFYFLDINKEKEDVVNVLERNLNIKSFTVNSKVELVGANVEEQIQPPVEKWLRAFYDAKFVITDSFHGCVFAMLFNKPFAVIANPKRGLARFKILNTFHQEHRLFYIEDFQPERIDFSLPNIYIEEMRKKSLFYLEQNLK